MGWGFRTINSHTNAVKREENPAYLEKGLIQTPPKSLGCGRIEAPRDRPNHEGFCIPGGAAGSNRGSRSPARLFPRSQETAPLCSSSFGTPRL